ncbi:MAG: ferrous iron transport protein B, partial [Chloroflexi bacterium]|nr:ferrous iron transport protein B [Chloroflexota bacterium]
MATQHDIEQGQRTISVALAGQPNVGKSTVFNLLTGLNQHVGNWPGKTVELKTGTYTYNGTTIRLVDLPGTYSLSANSPEEVVAREFIILERPDVVVVVVNAAQLERSLYLLAEILPLGAPVIVGLNMTDVAEQEGMGVEPAVLQAALGVPVVSMSASKNQGVDTLIKVIDQVARDPEGCCSPKMPEIRQDHRDVLTDLERLIVEQVPAPYPVSWVALKLLEGDTVITRMMTGRLPPERWDQVHDILADHEDAVVAVASGRYDWIGRMIRAALVRPRPGQIGLTERLDRWATHPIWGMFILAGILGSVFWLTYTVGAPLQGIIDTYLVHAVANWVAGLTAGGPAWLTGLLVDGAIGGVGTVVTFTPILVIFFAALGLLEDTGYMARAAYVMDRFMHLMGLHGKSFLPLFLGFGCNVPSIMGTRIIESRRAQLLTILLIPLVPCTGRLAVLAFLSPIFFGGWAPWAAFGLVIGALVVLAVSGVLLNRFLFRGERAAFIMELPLYHVPNSRTIGLFVWRHTVEFLKKAGSIILVVSVIVWALSYFPDGSVETSFLAQVGQVAAPIGMLMGLDWKLL